jgi:DNA-binding transcriptional LysR family regulator
MRSSLEKIVDAGDGSPAGDSNVLRVLNPLHLRTLSVVLRAGSFAAAGRQLGYTGSAVSQQMSALEADSGLTLFERGAHGIRPTAEARLLSERAGETLGALASLEDAVREIATGTRGRLGLGCFPTASEVLVPSALARFGRTFRNVEVRFDDGEPDLLLPRLVEGDLEIVVVYRYDLVPQIWPAGLRRIVLGAEEVRLLVPENYQPPAPRLQLADFAAASWIATREGSPGTLALERVCASAGFTPRIRYRSNDYDVVRSFVRAGFGVAAVPRLGFRGRIGLQALEVSDLNLHRHVEVLTVADRRSPAVDGMIAALKAAMAALPTTD